MSWTISQVKNGGWRTDARFVEVAAYDGAVAERDALQARLDEAVALLRRIYYDTADDVTRKVFAAPDSVASYAADFCVLDAARAFLSTLDNGGA